MGIHIIVVPYSAPCVFSDDTTLTCTVMTYSRDSRLLTSDPPDEFEKFVTLAVAPAQAEV